MNIFCDCIFALLFFFFVLFRNMFKMQHSKQTENNGKNKNIRRTKYFTKNKKKKNSPQTKCWRYNVNTAADNRKYLKWQRKTKLKSK